MFPPFFYNIIEMFPVIAPLDLFMIGGEITYHYSISRMAKPPEPSFVQSSALDNHYQYFNIKKKEEPLQPFPIQTPVYRRKRLHYREHFNRDSTSCIIKRGIAKCFPLFCF